MFYVKFQTKLFYKYFYFTYAKRTLSSNWLNLDIKYLLDPANKKEIKENLKYRESSINFEKILDLWENISVKKFGKVDSCDLLREFYEYCALFPNKSHPSDLEGLRTHKIGNFTGRRSYYLIDQLAQVEWALILYTIDFLTKNNFQIISVPDFVSPTVIENCGMQTTGPRTQVYWLNREKYGNICLAGTAEITLANFWQNQIIKESELPCLQAALSRCFRAEVSSTKTEKSIFRVHQFFKVEMFAITLPEYSDIMLKKLVDLQEEIFSSLDLHCQVLDMPACELGNSAYQKIDIETWMPGNNMFGEISSASNCTDYQSRRLPIKYISSNGHICFPHTLNGTACALPRMLIALLETHQKEDGSIFIPLPLQPYMGNISVLRPSSQKKFSFIFR